MRIGWHHLLGPLLLAAGLSTPLSAAPSHGLAMHGDLKYPKDFQHFEYADPKAPKGGEVRLAEIGTFDNLNPFILKGIAAAGIGRLFDTLTVGADDEPFSVYGLVAETIETPADRAWVAYTLRKEARFHDGHPIEVEDVIFSLQALKTQGHPFYRAYYANVTKAEKTGPRKVTFYFGERGNRELPLIVGQLPILPQHYWQGKEFAKTTLEAPLGSGPYRVAQVDPGRSISYQRDPDYWGRDLPVNKGRHNFDRIRHDYYRDATVALEALKAGEYDLRQENISKNWATAYDIPQVASGEMKKEMIRHEQPTGMQAFVFNTRREIFKDARVREALGYAFDYEWTNKNLFYGAYTRTQSYFSNSELASSGTPSGEELQLLESYRDRLPAELFSQPFQLPKTDGKGSNRRNLRQAARLLREAGWTIKERRLVNPQGRPFEFEILLVSPSFERIALPFAKGLERLGINARVRTVDATQFQNRLNEFDYDMMVYVWGQSLSPGNEQRDFWHSDSADISGSRNFAGIKDPVVDELVEGLIAAQTRPQLVTHARALDRVLLWGHYVIPHWHIRSFRVAYWDRFSRPAISPKYALGFDTWWIDPAKDARLKRQGSAAN